MNRKLLNFIGTPSFFINGKLLDARQGITANSLSQEIDKILQKGVKNDV